MTSKLLVLATAAGCIAAAGIGSYVAVWTTATDFSAPPVSAAPADVPDRDRATEASVALPPAPRNQSISATRASTATSRLALPEERRREPEAVPPVSPAVVEPTDTPPALAVEPLLDVRGALPRTELPALSPTVAEPALPTAHVQDALEVPAQAVLGIRLETSVSSERNRVEDPVTARLARDVTVDGRTVLPEGTEVVGYVSLVERGGRLRERARLGIRFTAIVLPDDTRIPIDTPVVLRDGDSKAGESTAKVGASAVIGGILGGIVGGKRGAAIGGAAGAAGGTAAVMAGDRSEAALAAGSSLTVRLNKSITVPSDFGGSELR